VALVARVIALLGVQIARERARPRPNREVIAQLEAERGAAVMVCRRLSSDDPDGVDEVCREYARLYRRLVETPSAPSPWANRQVGAG
jgi:hypothetical protein